MFMYESHRLMCVKHRSILLRPPIFGTSLSWMSVCLIVLYNQPLGGCILNIIVFSRIGALVVCLVRRSMGLWFGKNNSVVFVKRFRKALFLRFGKVTILFVIYFGKALVCG